jgi:hypothetical protein
LELIPGLALLETTMSKEDAVKALRAAGHSKAADELEAWRNAQGKDGGWDQWLRTNYPELVPVVWK